MREVVVVVTYKRDPLLYLCLEAIRAQEPDLPLVLISDRGHRTPELTRMEQQFNCELYVMPERNEYGNSFAVFMGMFRGIGWLTDFRYGITQQATLHFIEDDTIVYPGLFAWARAALQGSKYAVALGRVPADAPSTWYESPCASWDAKALDRCLKLIPPGYSAAHTREEMQKIADQAFPNSSYRYGSAEQDGFFLRALEHLNLKTAFPPKSFASHLGWYGYNRPSSFKPPEGSFDEQIAECRKVLHNKKRRYELFGQSITDREMGGM